MRRVIVEAGFFVVACSAVFGQTPAPPPSFEVASVKPMSADSGAPGSNILRGGPGTSDPERITFTSVTMKRLLMAAYGVGPDQVSGPGWLDSERYAITAKVPPGTDKPEVKAMLRHLLAERFHLQLHQETKDFPAYELMVAKRGPKLKPAGSSPPASGKNGFPQPLPGQYAAGGDGTVCRLAFNSFPISDLPKVLAIPLGVMAGNMLAAAPIVDKTGLSGKYDFTLEFAGYMGPGGAFPAPAPDGASAGPTLFEALEAQLGLKLVDKKAPLDVLVIDRVDKAPVGN